MMKQLEVLPSDRFEYVTASNLIDRYVGGSYNNTKEALRRAKGGILFIDEAYGMLPTRNHFGNEIMQALLDNITTDEYKGKIIIILGGYQEQVEELFNFNPGFQSRFDKMRVEFPEWSGQQASTALIGAIAKDGKTIADDAKHALSAYFEALCDLPNWASARDVVEIVKPALEQERSSRSFALAEKKRQLENVGDSEKKKTTGPKSSAAKKDLPPPIPYELSDVISVFTAILRNRGGDIENLSSSSKPTEGVISLKTSSQLSRYIKKSSNDPNVLLVVCYTDPVRCNPCKMFQPVYRVIGIIIIIYFDIIVIIKLSLIAQEKQKQGAIFIAVASEGFSDISSIPTTRLFYKGIMIIIINTMMILIIIIINLKANKLVVKSMALMSMA